MSKPAADVPAPSAQGVALVVEDHDDVRAQIADVLTAMGCEVVEASDGPRALQIIESRPPIDLLVTDVGLPGVNSWAACGHRPGSDQWAVGSHDHRLCETGARQRRTRLRRGDPAKTLRPRRPGRAGRRDAGATRVGELRARARIGALRRQRLGALSLRQELTKGTDPFRAERSGRRLSARCLDPAGREADNRRRGAAVIRHAMLRRRCDQKDV